MKVVLIGDNGYYHKEVTVKLWRHIVLPLAIFLVLMVGTLSIVDAVSTSSLAASKERDVRNDFRAVLHKLSVLDAEVQRLNTLSAYIASKSKVNISEFKLSKAPARGGSADLRKKNYFGSSIVRRKDVAKSLKKIEIGLIRQRIKLNDLVTSLEIREAEDDLHKAHRYSNEFISVKSSRNSLTNYEFVTPLKTGYISSSFGSRRDPINGSARHHNGLDIAAKKGTYVYAIANGFVTYRGRKGAYGNTLEINHSESLKSRYAHLSAFLVRKGGMVRKGDIIGEVGATGRVTGPHLHLEIRDHNKIVNPKTYIGEALGDAIGKR